MIGFVNQEDANWEKFDREAFDADKYPAHKAMHDTIKDEYTDLMSKYHDAKVLKDEQRRQQQQQRDQ